MSGIVLVLVVLVVIVATIHATAPLLAEKLVRARAGRFAITLSLRLEEEWLAELRAISNRPSQLWFAVALLLTPQQAFLAADEDSMTDTRDNPRSLITMFSDWRLLLVIPTVLFALAAYCLSFLLPVRYASESLIQAVPQAISEDFVHSSQTVPLNEQLTTLRQRLLSRTLLTQVIREFDLYRSNQRTRSLEGLVQSIRNNITININPDRQNGGEGVFTIRFVGSEPGAVQKVAAKLTTLILQQSNGQREADVRGTRVFLEWQLDELARRIRNQRELLARPPSEKGQAPGVPALDHELLQSTYKALFAKVEEARMAEALESRQKGRTFVVIDPAYFPEQPFSPDRAAITAVGALVGCFSGGVTVGGLSRKRRRALA